MVLGNWYRVRMAVVLSQDHLLSVVELCLLGISLYLNFLWTFLVTILVLLLLLNLGVQREIIVVHMDSLTFEKVQLKNREILSFLF